MAAYAGVVSLMTTLDNIHNHPIHSLSLDEKQSQSLHQILGFLLDFIGSYNSRRGSREDEVLESRIARAAQAAEDVIESHVVDQIHYAETSSSVLLDLEEVIKDMNSVMETVMKFQETEEFTDLQPSPSAPTTSSSAKNVMVGCDDELIQIMDRLTGHEPSLQIVPIVGMGGIGKTTMANNVYNNIVVVEHFDIRAWATISHGYSIVTILSEINKSLRACDCEMDLEENEDELGVKLGVKLYQSLCGRRYLIVLDDIWSIEVWDKIRVFFPHNDCKSRVVITTRISNVATNLSSSSFKMNFLDEDKSWKLFCGKTFLERDCPPYLEKIGKKIARDCKGLPLSISVIGGLLRNSRTREYWESVARDTNSILMLDKDEHCLNILLLSYNQLPAHLKPCFLYMGVFPENHRVYASLLIKFFVSEGFIKPNKTQSLEQIADDYLNDLADRNLILVDRKRRKGTIKYFRMHNLVREVCLRIGKKEKFFNTNPPDISRERHIVCYRRNHFSVPSLARTYKFPLPSKCRLLRVLCNVDFESMEAAIFQLVNLRYLSYNPSLSFNPSCLPSKLPSSISQLWNLQTLIMNRRVYAPVEIWHMRQLRHLQFRQVFLSNPAPSENVDHQDDLFLPNLHTFTKVMNFSFSEQECKRIPNIKELSIRYESNCYLTNLVDLLKLESLECSFGLRPKRDDLLKSLVFPRTLIKLSLLNCGLHWDDLKTCGFSLPHLEVLKLYRGAVVGPEWDCVEGAFPCLRFLKIRDASLRKWTAEDTDFPKLEKLHLQNLNKLEEIPSGVGDIQTLQYLHLYRCSESAIISATEILEEQRSLGNDYLQVEVFSAVKSVGNYTDRSSLTSTMEDYRTG